MSGEGVGGEERARQVLDDYGAWEDEYLVVRAMLAYAAKECAAGKAEGREEAARLVDPPLMHRKGRVGLWRQRRAAIATAIRDLQP